MSDTETPIQDLERAWRLIVNTQPLKKFVNLQVGDKFIVFPKPGDNAGNGGFSGDIFLFIKIEPTMAKGKVADREVLVEHSAIRASDSSLVYMPLFVDVIKIV